jgi:ATP-binding cassette subfamily B protein
MPSRRSPLARLLAYARPYRRRLRLAAASSVLNKIFDLAPPLLIGAAVDLVITKEGSLLARLGVRDLEAQLWLLAGLTIAIWALESLAEYAQDVLWRNLAQSLQHDLRMDAYAHVQGLELAYF